MKERLMSMLTSKQLNQNQLRCASSFRLLMKRLDFQSLSENELKDVTGSDNAKAIIIGNKLMYKQGLNEIQLFISVISELINTTSGLSYVINSTEYKDYRKKLKICSFAILAQLDIIKCEPRIKQTVAGKITGIFENGRNDDKIDYYYDMIKDIDGVAYIQELNPYHLAKHIQKLVDESENIQVAEYMDIVRYIIPIRYYKISDRGLQAYLNINSAVYIENCELIYGFDERIKEFNEHYNILAELEV